jgi:UDP-glucuronate decarboxylase
MIPTPETYRGNVSCTGPRACYDESKRYGETLCVNFAQQSTACRSSIARPVQQLRAGAEDHRPAGALPDFARDVLAGRDIVMLSDGTPTRTFCYVADAVVGYYKILVRGRDGEAYNIGVEEPEISMAELADKVVALGGELFGYEGPRGPRRQRGPQLPGRQPEPALPDHRQGRSELGYAPRSGSTRGCGARCSGTGKTAAAEDNDEGVGRSDRATWAS